ncbi:SCO7613 C-terminal domain-containing membrane protein, partial [Micromonospora sp. URMC 105]|uniref:SCO7613 C-terminal domain-containing membrane protein n=1 Tax=Micromonospora sp. URMC 105 TaxID=3423413 RepID=UPI003F1C887A
PARLRSGPRVGALIVAGGLAQVGVLATLLVAGGAVARSLPAWRGAAAGPAYGWGWQLPVAVALTAAAIGLLLPRAARSVTALAGVALTAFALPAVAATSWPAALAVDLAVGAGLLLAVVHPGRRTPAVLVGSLAGAALLGHALLVALAAPGGMLAALGVLLPAGLTVAALARRGTPAQHAVAGSGLAVALLAGPAGTVVALLAAGSPPWWQLRAGFAAVVLPLVALGAVRRHWPDLDGYASTATAVALGVGGLAPVVVPAAEPVTLYAALAALALAVVDRDAPASVAGRAVGAVLAVVATLAAAPVALTALFSPYDGAVEPWAGVPATAPLPGGWPAGAALLVLAAAGLAARQAQAGRAVVALPALPFAAAALPVLLVTAGAPWPVVPAVALLIGLAALLAAALSPPRPLLGAVAVPVGLLWTLAGLTGLAATRAGTLAGLALLVVAAVVAGVAGRRAEVRLTGCLVAVGAATGLAVTASLAAGLPLHTAGFAVLAVAAAALSVAPPLARRTPVAGRAAEGAAQAVALVALLLTAPAPRQAAAVCVLWGVAVALRVLRRGESAERRWAFAGIAGGSELLGAWLLLADGGVVLLEAYTLPAAALALVAGVVALRSRPGLTSWPALGPGLAAGLLPGLVSVLVAPEPQPWRRLLLGVAALGVVLAGATRRWQAPVVLGGTTLALLALHELVRGWDLLPRWIFLAAGGFALIALAATYERRRRDLTRLRAAVGRMG